MGSTYQTSGLVIKRINLGEADRLITFLTPQYGKLRAVARGVRKIRSKLAGHLELFAETQLMLAKGRNLDVVAGARLKSYPEGLVGDYQALATAYLLAEMVDKLVAEASPQPEIYHLTLAGLQGLAEGRESSLVELHFKLKLLVILGYRPNLSQCAVCGRRMDPSRAYWFDHKLGGIVDETCYGQGSLALSSAIINHWQNLLDSDEVSPRPLPPEVRNSLDVLDRFYEYLFNRQFTSQQILAP